MKKILQPIDLESVDNNSFRRLFWPHGTHHSLQRILNGPIDVKPKSSYKAENPLMMQRLMKYCEVRLLNFCSLYEVYSEKMKKMNRHTHGSHQI